MNNQKKIIFKNGSYYSGEQIDGVPNGNGFYHHKNGDIIYGNFLQGVVNGYGYSKTQDGKKYIGEWYAGFKHGVGTETDGESLIGTKAYNYIISNFTNPYDIIVSILKANNLLQNVKFNVMIKTEKAERKAGDIFDWDFAKNFCKRYFNIKTDFFTDCSRYYNLVPTSPDAIWTIGKDFGYRRSRHFVQIGCCKSECFSGLGKIFYDNGNMLYGYFKYSVLNGSGYFLDAKMRTIYVGNWAKGKKNGEFEIINMQNSSLKISKMTFEMDKQVETKKEPETLKVQTEIPQTEKPKDEKPKDEYTKGQIQNSYFTYEGEIKNGLPHGYGFKRMGNKDSYLGNFKNGLYDGYGELCTTQFTYEGGFKYGHKYGAGQLTTDFDNCKYIGTWLDDKKVGVFIVWRSSKLEVATFIGDKVQTSIRYQEEGTQVNQQNQGLNGWHTKTYSNGNVYKGEFADNKRNGPGTLYDSDGYRLYEGDWEDDEKNGYGTEWANDGCYTGYFKNGYRHGQGRLDDLKIDGYTKKGNWNYGSTSARWLRTDEVDAEEAIEAKKSHKFDF